MSAICLKWRPVVLPKGQQGDNVVDYLPITLPVTSVKSAFNLTPLGNAKPPASKDGSSKTGELQNALNSPLLGDKRIISTQAES